MQSVSRDTFEIAKRSARAVYAELGEEKWEHPTWKLLQRRIDHDVRWELHDQKARQLFVNILTKLHSYPHISLTVLGLKADYGDEIEVSYRTWEQGLLFIDLVMLAILDPAVVNPPPPPTPLFPVRRV